MILVVDDHDDTRNALLRLLKLDGYEAVGVTNGEDALAYLAGTVPKLVILDWGLPDMEGLDVFGRMRGVERLAGVPVIVFSAYEGMRRERALAAGVNAYIVKGALDWGHLKGEIERLAGSGTLPRELPRMEGPGMEQAG